ncbi:MAG: hypothetical protein FH754_18170 [Marinobacter sp.]|nr:hypothetical protein [Marinobacter sp.]
MLKWYIKALIDDADFGVGITVALFFSLMFMAASDESASLVFLAFPSLLVGSMAIGAKEKYDFWGKAFATTLAGGLLAGPGAAVGSVFVEIFSVRNEGQQMLLMGAGSLCLIPAVAWAKAYFGYDFVRLAQSLRDQEYPTTKDFNSGSPPGTADQSPNRQAVDLKATKVEGQLESSNREKIKQQADPEYRTLDRNEVMSKVIFEDLSIEELRQIVADAPYIGLKRSDLVHIRRAIEKAENRKT